MAGKQPTRTAQEPEIVAGNGLLHRRALLGSGVMLAGAAAAGIGATSAAAEPLKDGPWSLRWGQVLPAYQVPSRFERNVVRTLDNPDNVPRNCPAAIAAGTDVTPACRIAPSCVSS